MIRPYNWLARYYDPLFAAYRGPMDEAREKLLGGLLPEVESACDLACGTGTTAVALARRGIRMYGVDLSPVMCRLAREKAKKARVRVRVSRGDMRTFRLPETVDLITCEYDALNHVPAKEDLKLVANAVARALRPGGRFLFDVNNRLGFKSYWNLTMWVERPGVVLVMRNGEDHMHDRAWCDVEWFIRDGPSWKRRRERVEEVCWSEKEIRSALRGAGFDRVRAWDAAPFFRADPLIQRGCRTVYLARKAQR